MIVITTPTGAIGHQVLENVLRATEPVRVIARDPSRLPSHVRELVDVVQGSHSDATVVNKAFAGADVVFGSCHQIRVPRPWTPRTSTSLVRHAPPSRLRESNA